MMKAFSVSRRKRNFKIFDFSFITEKYTRGVSAVESILVLDRLRQSVAVKEIEQTQSKQQLSMRKTASVPNFSQVIFEINPAIITLNLVVWQ